MEQKLIFFDIDGTVKPFRSPVPADTRAAIQKLKANGHIPVICTGRTRVMVKQTGLVEDPGFPAQICGAGMEVIYQGQTVYQRFLDRETVQWTVDRLQRWGCGFVLEGSECLYYPESWGDRIKARWGREARPKMLRYDPATSQVQKITILNRSVLEGSKALEELSQVYQVLCYDDGNTAELVLRGISKAVGIQGLLKFLGMDIRDTYAFGDGLNDMEMLQYVQYGVAMGNAQEEVKRCAKYHTASCDEGGIALALQRFGLIEPD